MVPASTSRRKAATTAGSSSSTSAMSAVMIIQSWIIVRLLSGSERRHDAPVPRRVDLLDADEVTGAHSNTRRAVGRAQRGEHLDDLPIQLQRHQPVPVPVESGNGADLVLDAGLERSGGTR